MLFSQKRFGDVFRTKRNALFRKLKPYLVRAVHNVRGGWRAEWGIRIARTCSFFYASSFVAATHLHFLYILNRHDELQDVAWEVALGNPKYLRNQFTLHMLLKSAWIIQDDALIELVIDVLKNSNMSVSNSLYITARQSAHPAMRYGAMHLASKAKNKIRGMRPRNAIELQELINSVNALDAAEMFELQPSSIDTLESMENEPAIYRYLARRAVRYEKWETAYQLFDKAREADPKNVRNYLDLVETALYLPGPLERCVQILDKREQAYVKPVEYDRPLGLKHLLESNILAFLELRDVLVSNRAAYQEFGAATHQSMGLNATKYQKSDQSCFVIGRDGVSDEVRWSYYYSEFAKHYERASISCDPRLLSLFQRSFPTISFFPVARNWGKAKVRDGDVPRDKVPNMELASRLDNIAFAEAKKADQVMFIEDVASRDWKTRGINGPSSDGEPAGNTLSPNPERAKYWKERFSKDEEGKLKVGLIWRSGHVDIDRQRHYMQLDDFSGLVHQDIDLYSIQHQVTDQERAKGQSMGIRFVDNEVDFYDDFEEIAAMTSQLDVVLGISTLPYELAGAVGTECWLCAISPLGRWMRLGATGERKDKLTRNGLVFYPRLEEGYLASREDRVRDIMAQVNAEISKKLS